jgi:hypothetical protein
MTASLDHAPAKANNLRQFLTLALGSVGVVYGDIGTPRSEHRARQCHSGGEQQHGPDSRASGL